jgi:hypothetical protein
MVIACVRIHFVVCVCECECLRVGFAFREKERRSRRCFCCHKTLCLRAKQTGIRIMDLVEAIGVDQVLFVGAVLTDCPVLLRVHGMSVYLFT